MNKRIIILIIALAALRGGAMAQQKQSMATRPRQVDYSVVKATVIGTSSIRILYAFNAKDLKDEDPWIDCGQLLPVLSCHSHRRSQQQKFVLLYLPAVLLVF